MPTSPVLSSYHLTLMVVISVLEPETPMTPPVGLKAMTLSSTAVILTWTDSTLGRSQRVTDGRIYTVRYRPNNNNNNAKFKFINGSNLNQHIDDLRPSVEYEFSVKVIKVRRESTWSLSAYNRTAEDREFIQCILKSTRLRH